jgi:hypothetical protein
MNRYRRRALLLAILVSASVSSFAETPPPIAPFDAITWKATMKQKPSTGLRMGAFRVRFERTTLDDVRRVASVGEIAHRGDAGESAYWLCYTIPGAAQAERIWIVAHGEMGGREHYITNISAEFVPNGSATADCPALPNNLKPLSLDNRLWLGASEGTALAKLGAPSYKKGAWRSYDFQGKVPGKCEGSGFDLVAWLLLHFQNGRIKSLQVGQVTSC